MRRRARTSRRIPAPSWLELAELGWTGVSVPEEDGGAGLGFLEEAVLFEEMGRALTHAPYWSTIAVTLPALPADLQAEVARGEASWALANGPLVADLDTATRIAYVGGDAIWELEGAEREVLHTNDETRPLGVVSGGTAGRRLAGSELLPHLRARSLTALALEACGVGRQALDLAVEFAKERRQFGKAIGTYQAISHPLATTLMELELGRSLALYAAWCISEGDTRAPIAAAAAKSHCAEAAVVACERAIQAHGGIGFTWEHVLHRLYKRSLGILALGGFRGAAPRRDRRPPPGRRAHRMNGLMMDYQLNVPAILRRGEELFGPQEIVSRLPDKSWHRYHLRRCRGPNEAARARAPERARPRRRRPGRNVRVEPPRASGDVHRRSRGRVRHAHAEPAASCRRPDLHRLARR